MQQIFIRGRMRSFDFEHIEACDGCFEFSILSTYDSSCNVARLIIVSIAGHLLTNHLFLSKPHFAESRLATDEEGGPILRPVLAERGSALQSLLPLRRRSRADRRQLPAFSVSIQWSTSAFHSCTEIWEPPPFKMVDARSAVLWAAAHTTRLRPRPSAHGDRGDLRLSSHAASAHAWNTERAQRRLLS